MPAHQALTRRPSRASVLVAFLGCTAAAGGAAALTEAPEDPDFGVVIVAQPIVVVATAAGVARESERRFDAVPGDVDPTPAYAERYLHYRFRTARTIKGKVPAEFEVRVPARSRLRDALESLKRRDALLVLAPDYGRDGQGRPSSGFLVAHGAAYPITDGALSLPPGRGTGPWTVERVIDTIADAERARAERRARGPEPPDAAKVAVVAGEDRPREERPPPPAASKRPRGPLPAAELAEVAPESAEGPRPTADRKRASEPPGWAIPAALLAVLLLLLI